TIKSSKEASFGVTYTSILSDYEESSDVGYSRVIVYGYDGLPMYPVDPPSLDYVPGPEEPESKHRCHWITCQDQSTLSTWPYLMRRMSQRIADYPADGWDDDNDDDDDDDSSRDDVDDEDEEEASDDEEEEEHLAPADSIVVASPLMDLVPSTEEIEPFKTDEFAATPPPPPAYHTTARMFEVEESSTAIVARQPGLWATRTTDYGFTDMVDDAPRRHVPREIRYGITDT
ncbi:hypothetical protein Tco_1497041, partial [Tanacetum coccineum]